MRLQKVYLIFCLLFYSSIAAAQEAEKCATVPYNKQINSRLKYSDQEFEEWLKSKVLKKRASQAVFRTTEDVYTIPVVLHIIHNGETLGTGANIPQSQINEQMRILNEDFRRKNADTSKTPDLFRPFSTDTKIEFKLAVQDPDGVPTTGIVRINGKKGGWRFENGDELKKISYWPSDQYLNIWVVNMTDNTIGYSQFPTSRLLPGLEEGSDVAETDGVVIHYKEFGMGGNANRRSRGRTVTHEIGHFFGLKHIWGDDDGRCSGSDYVEDTPNQAGANNNCPGFPKSSCDNTSDMFMNFMDYSPDTCMNIFTIGQKERMRAIIENSPRRTSLLTSPALTTPVNLPLDAAISKILSPVQANCGSTVNPSFILRNTGLNTLTSITIDYKINDLSFTKTEQLNLARFDTTIIHLPQINLTTDPGNYTLTIELKNPNGGTDQRLSNNILSTNFYITTDKSLPYTDDLNDDSDIIILNPASEIKWEIKNAGGSGTPPRALGIDLSNTSAEGATYDFVSPNFNTKGLDSLSVSFKYAYAQKTTSSNDGLSIRVSIDCGKTFLTQDELYYNTGASFATVEPRESSFTPSRSDQWREECINLSRYIGYDNVQIKFTAISRGGNSLFIDDLNFNFSTCGMGPVGVDDEEISGTKFNVYPNPSDGTLFVDLSLPLRQDFEIRIMDAFGKTVLKQNFRNIDSLHQPVNLSTLSSGLYFIKIHGKTINLDRKILINK